MWGQFFAENIHFALNLFMALVLFAIAWLYFDAWNQRKTLKDGAKIAGLVLICLSYVIHATVVESSIVGSELFLGRFNPLLVSLTRIFGYLLLIFGVFIDPLQPRPTQTKAFFLPLVKVPLLLPVLFPVLAAWAGFLLLRRATKGLENHIKPVALGFYLLAVSDLVGLSALFRETTNVDFYRLVAAFGPLWIFEHIFLGASALVLGYWVYYYLLKRFSTQLFMIFTTSILVIFLLTTVAFTGLLLKNLQDETLDRLTTDARVLSYAVESKKAELLSDGQLLAQDAAVVSALVDGKREGLAEITEETLLNKKHNFLVIVNDSGVVQARGEDRERIGDSLSDDPLIKRVVLGEAATSVVTKDGALSPEVSVRASVPVKSGDTVVGAVMAGYGIDNAFVDGIKKATGLEAGVYGDNILSATTVLAADGKSRYLGTKIEDEKIKEKVLGNAESFSGSVSLLNTLYFASYLPLTDADGNPVGMLSVAKPQVGVLAAAGRSIELTFLVTAALMVISVVPSYFISKYLASQIT